MAVIRIHNPISPHRLSGIALFLFFLLCSHCRGWAHYFEFTPPARQAYELATSLRFDEANAVLSRIHLRDPDNLIVYHIANYIDFFKLYINEDEAVYDQLKNNRDRRLAKIETQGDPNDPYYLYAQANIRLQWALVRLKFGHYLGAFTDVNKAHKLLEENRERFPDFMPNYKDLGILHAMVGTIPDNYLWGVKLLSGLEGTIAQGKAEIERVRQYAKRRDFIFGAETDILYAFLLLHLSKEEDKAWEVVRQTNLQPEDNPLHGFVMANIAMRTGRNDRAIQLLEACPRGDRYLAFPYLDFMLGLARLRKLDAGADQPLKRFLESYDGANFVKEAYQKLAWHQLLRGRTEGYQKYMKLCREKGAADTGGDASALKEAEDGRHPPVELIRARLLFDGGYYQQAYNRLRPLTPTDFPHARGKLEYVYRMGRILHGLQRYEEAIDYYKRTIALGREASFFFACNAALQMALIEEQKGNYPEAKAYFQLCLKIKPEEYQTGLHQQAKSGLDRLKQR